MRAVFDTTFEAGDVVGKLMVFVAQLRACSEDTRDYLVQIAILLGCPSWMIKLWVRTCWGSLSDCFRTVLATQKVCYTHIVHCMSRTHFRICSRPSTASVALLTTTTTYLLSPMGRSGPTTCFPDQSGRSSSLRRIVWRSASHFPIKHPLNIMNRFYGRLTANYPPRRRPHATRYFVMKRPPFSFYFTLLC